MRLIIKDARHWNRKRDLLNFTVLSLVTIILWIGFEIYRTYSRSTITEDIKPHLEPLNPSLDRQTLDSLSKRSSLSEDLILSAPVPAESQSASPAATASPSANPNF